MEDPEWYHYTSSMDNPFKYQPKWIRSREEADKWFVVDFDRRFDRGGLR